MQSQPIPGTRPAAVSIRHFAEAAITGQLTDALHCRWLFELSAAGLAAQRATEADLRALREAVTLGADEAIEADLAFHRAVAAAANNALLSALIDSLLAAIPAEVHVRLQASTGAGDHERILLAVERGSRTEAQRAMRVHLGPMRGAAAEIEAHWRLGR
jgi:DNA-binding FadR family transcriptional regulator